MGWHTRLTRDACRREAKDHVAAHEHHPFIQQLRAEGRLEDFIEYLAETYHLG